MYTSPFFKRMGEFKHSDAPDAKGKFNDLSAGALASWLIKTCLPASKIRSMSKEQRQKLVNSKKAAGAKGKYKRSSKTNVKGARKKGATLRDWFEKEDWRRVDDPSKKCGE